MSPADSRACVRVSPGGVQAWLAHDRPGIERDLVERLLASPAGTVADLPALARQTHRPVAELARTLFRLNRTQCLWIGDEQHHRQADGPASLAELSDDLGRLAGDGRAAVISDADGLCIAASGLPAGDADRAAASAFAGEPAARWWFSSGQLTIAVTGTPDPGSPAWVRIARRLLHAGGPLASRAIG